MKQEPKFKMFLANLGDEAAIDLFAFNSEYGINNTGKESLRVTTIIYDILELAQKLDVQYEQRSKASNNRYLDLPMRITIERLQAKIRELERMQKEFDDEP